MSHLFQFQSHVSSDINVMAGVYGLEGHEASPVDADLSESLFLDDLRVHGESVVWLWIKQ